MLESKPVIDAAAKALTFAAGYQFILFRRLAGCCASFHDRADI
jgi:hypothetical protein